MTAGNGSGQGEAGPNGSAQGGSGVGDDQAQSEAMAFHHVMTQAFEQTSPEHVLASLNAVPQVGAVDGLYALIDSHGEEIPLDPADGMLSKDVEAAAGLLGVTLPEHDVAGGTRDAAYSLNDALRLASWIQSLRAANLAQTTTTSLSKGVLAQVWEHHDVSLRATFRAMFLAAALADALVNGLAHDGPGAGQPPAQMASQFVLGTLIQAALSEDAARYGMDVFVPAGKMADRGGSELGPDGMIGQANMAIAQLMADGILIPMPGQDPAETQPRFLEFTVDQDLRPAVLNLIDGLARHLLPGGVDGQPMFGGQE